VIDAAGLPLGRLASAVAQLIRGKHKPSFTPHMDGGDFVIVLNASKVKFTGRKLSQKTYFKHTGYMGHESHTVARDLMDTHPDRVIEKAVFGMLPKNSLAKQHMRGQAQGVRRCGASAHRAAEAVHRYRVQEGDRMSATLDQFRWQAVGRRKTSVARVYLTPGTGKWDGMAARWVTTSRVRRWCNIQQSFRQPSTWARSMSARW
jgi:large subunit ribosomal protein L13